MSRRKPSQGVCGKCGRATLKPTQIDLDRVKELAIKSGRPTMTVSGHTFSIDDMKLMEVLCVVHQSKSF